MLIHMQNGASGIWAVQLRLCWGRKPWGVASLQPPSFYADHRPWSLPSTIPSATMTGAARELSGPKDDPRSSRSRFRGCRRNSQIHCSTVLATLLSWAWWWLAAAGFEPTSKSCLPRLWPREEYTQTGAHQRAVPATSPAVQSTSEWQYCKLCTGLKVTLAWTHRPEGIFYYFSVLINRRTLERLGLLANTKASSCIFVSWQYWKQKLGVRLFIRTPK